MMKLQLQNKNRSCTNEIQAQRGKSSHPCCMSKKGFIPLTEALPNRSYLDDLRTSIRKPVISFYRHQARD
uniref:Uncharacterized protein n=1 Tax=Rhizophora mucronata TaxID=61149 RepID=A0A2P2M6M9_RHIMU